MQVKCSMQEIYTFDWDRIFLKAECGNMKICINIIQYAPWPYCTSRGLFHLPSREECNRAEQYQKPVLPYTITTTIVNL